MQLPRTRRRSGFTLIELMVTMGIMAMLLGLGATMFLTMGKRSADQQALASVNQLVTRARNASNRFPATIVPVPGSADGATPPRIHAYTDEVLQELHFDARPTTDGKTIVPMGIEGLECKLLGGNVEDRAGRVGGAAKLGGGSVDCGNYAAYDVDQGISAEAWIRPLSGPKCDLVTKGRTFIVRLADTKAGSPGRATVKLMLQQPNGTQEVVEYPAPLPPIRANEWFGLRVSFDRREVVIAANEGFGWVVAHRVVFKKPEDLARTLAVDRDASLIVGSGLNGWLDDVRIGGIRSAEPVTMPRGMDVLPGRSIRFVNGRLDAATHAGAEVIGVKAEGRVLSFVIGQDGTILSVEEGTSVAAKDGFKEPVPTPLKKE